MTRMRPLLVSFCALASVCVPRAALACPVCFGQSDAPLAKAMNLGVIAMLVVVVAVLSGFAAFIFFLARRARAFELEHPGHVAHAGLAVSSGSDS